MWTAPSQESDKTDRSLLVVSGTLMHDFIENAEEVFTERGAVDGDDPWGEQAGSTIESVEH